MEALTQHLPSPGPGGPVPLVPDTLPAIFLDIARHCLQRDPQHRWTVGEVSARLNPGSAAPSSSAAKPASAPSPAHLAASAVPAILANVPQTSAPASLAPAKVQPARPTTADVANQTVLSQTVAVRGTSARHRYDLVQPQLKRPPLLPPLPKLNYLPLSIVAVLVLSAIFLGPRLLHRAPAQQTAHLDPQSTPTVKAVPAVAHAKNASKSALTPAPPTVPASALQRASQAPVRNDKTSLGTPTPAPAALTSVAGPPRVETTVKAAGPVTQGEVLDQILPDVSPKARATIRGTVHVAVKLHVDNVGNVASAELFLPGPSKYFADQALQAAHRWDFAPAKVDGHAVPSEWLVRFEFTPFDTKAHPTQSTP